MRLARRMTVCQIGRGSAPAPGSVTAYYSSPGGGSDYAEASTNVAARVVFDGVGPAGPCTVAGWYALPVGIDSAIWRARFDPNNPDPPIASMSVSESAVGAYYAGSLSSASTSGGSLVDDEWHRIAVTIDRAADAIIVYLDGSAVATSAIGADVADGETADYFRTLVADGWGTLAASNIVINDRAHTAGEEAALYAASITHHPLLGTGAWAADQSIPVIWCTPAVGGVVANSGDGGVCNLVLNGAVTSETLP